MTLEKVIEILRDKLSRPEHDEDPDFPDAVKLAIEAVKARKERQEHLSPQLRSLLPSETED